MRGSQCEEGGGAAGGEGLGAQRRMRGREGSMRRVGSMAIAMSKYTLCGEGCVAVHVDRGSVSRPLC